MMATLLPRRSSTSSFSLSITAIGKFKRTDIFCFILLSIDWDILFADDEREANPATFKFIQNALAWKNKEGVGKASMLDELLAEEDSEEEDEDEDEDDEKSSNEGDRMRD
jgi:hypothetical protein